MTRMSVTTGALETLGDMGAPDEAKMDYSLFGAAENRACPYIGALPA
jgi:hypothetical protein